MEIAAVLMISLVLVFGSAPPVHAATTIVLDSSGCTTIGGVWDIPTTTCDLVSSYTLNSGDVLDIPSGTTLFIPSSSTFHVVGTVNNDGDINNFYVVIDDGTVNNSGVLAENCGGTFTNFENVVNSGTIINYGACTLNGVSFTGTFTNSGFGTITNTALIVNYGVFNNLGTIDDTCGGTFTNEAGSTYVGTAPSTTTCTTTTATTTTSTTTTSTVVTSVPEFPGAYSLVFLAFALPVLALMARKSMRPGAG